MDEEDMDDAFYHAFVHAGSIIAQCDCGINHIADDEFEYLEDEEKSEIIEFERKYPDKVIHYDYTSISWGFIGDKEIVYGCPCKYDKKLQHFLVDNQHQIVDFYRRLLKLEKEQVLQKEEALSEVE